MLLKLENVKKTYGKIRALDNFSAEFEQGIYGILGPNGAGKSTMINLITDNLKRDHNGGSISYDGEDILTLGKRFRGKIGYMPQEHGFFEQMTAWQFLAYMANVKCIPKKESKNEIEKMLETVGLLDKKHLKVGGFSGGMRQRIMLAQALLGNPEIIILDEPTTGLDPKERINFRNFISEIAADKIVLIATHVVSDIECIANQILIIDKGRLLIKDSPANLIGSMEGMVAEAKGNIKEIEIYRENYAVGNLRQSRDGMRIRLVKKRNDEKEFNDEFDIVNDINLEDVYLHYFGK